MPVHVLCLIDALTPRGTKVGRTAALIRQRLQRYGCQLIVLGSLKQFPAATRCSLFSLPVETLTAPRIQGSKCPLGKAIRFFCLSAEVFHGAVNIALGAAISRRGTLIIKLFALAEPQLQLDPPALEIQRKRHQRIALQFDLLR